MQALKRFMFLFLATIISVASTSFAFSSNKGVATNSNASIQLSETAQDQSDVHFASNLKAKESLLDVIVDFEEEEDEGKKKFSTYFVGNLTQVRAPFVQDTYQKQWIGQRYQFLQAQSVRLHLLIRRIQV